MSDEVVVKLDALKNQNAQILHTLSTIACDNKKKNEEDKATATEIAKGFLGFNITPSLIKKIIVTALAAITGVVLQQSQPIHADKVKSELSHIVHPRS